jgi:lipopolysaccharide export system permease protein
LSLRKLKRDYEDLGYSTSEITSHLNQLYSFPIYLSIMSVFSAIIMLNIKRNKPMIYHIISGVLFSVIIYYFYYLFSLLGENGKIPLTASTWLPLLLLMIFILIGLVRINEK